MALTTLAGYAAAAKQRQRLFSGVVVNSAGCRSDGFRVSTIPGVTTLPANTTTGVVPTNTTPGAMQLDPFSGSAYVTWIELTDAGSPTGVILYDRLWHAGNFLDTHGVYTLSSQPSYSSRVPGGTDYTGLQIWGTSSTNFNNSNSTTTVTYTDQSGNAGHSTGGITFLNPGTNQLGNVFQLPLASGDTGVQTIESVNFTSAANNGSSIVLFVARPLWAGGLTELRTQAFGLEQVGMPQVFAGSCLNIIVRAAAAAFGNSELLVEIASG